MSVHSNKISACGFHIVNEYVYLYSAKHVFTYLEDKAVVERDTEENKRIIRSRHGKKERKEPVRLKQTESNNNLD